MINPFLEINWRPEAGDLRKFGRTILIGFLIISPLLLAINIVILKYPLPHASFIPAILIIAAAAICLMSYFMRPLALPVYYVWFIAGASVGIIVSNLLLAAFFYLIFSPFAMIMRFAAGRDPLKLKKRGILESNWETCDAKKPPERYYKQY